LSTPKASVVDDDDVMPEFDFSRAIPSPFRDRARKGMRFHILTDGADLPTFHVTARRRRRAWWIEIDEIAGSGHPARWATLESTARRTIAQSQGIAPTDFDLVIDLPPIK
jgi:hypothetical protein